MVTEVVRVAMAAIVAAAAAAAADGGDGGGGGEGDGEGGSGGGGGGVDIDRDIDWTSQSSYEPSYHVGSYSACTYMLTCVIPIWRDIACIEGTDTPNGKGVPFDIKVSIKKIPCRHLVESP